MAGWPASVSARPFAWSARPATGGRATLALALAVVLALVAGLGVAAGAADARVTLRVTQERSILKSRLAVRIDSTTAFTARTRPRSVTLRYKRKTYRLRRVTRATSARSAAGRATAVATSRWQTGQSAAFNRLLGKRVTVTVRTAAGRRTYRRVVARPRPTFAPPRHRVSGEAAFRRIQRYFVNSRFTSCTEGWPACASERRYDHCAGGGLEGNWSYQTFPGGIGSLSGRYRVRDAWQGNDGTWGITYDVALSNGSDATYTWLVRPDETVYGAYRVGEDVGVLQDMRWQQPASC